MEVISIEVDAPEVHITPVGDVQLGAAAFDERRFQEHLDNAPADSLYIGMGDYHDFVSPSNRRKLLSMRSDESLYDVVWEKMDAEAHQDIAAFESLVERTEGQWLALLGGHHFWVFPNGQSSDEVIADDLDTPYVEGDVIVEVTYGDGITRRVHAWHGEGSAQTPTGVFNKMKRKDWVRADLYLMGHTHRTFIIPGNPEVDSIDPSSESGWSHRTPLYVNTGSFLRGYIRGSRTYVERGGLPPTALGGVYTVLRRDGSVHATV